MIWQNPWAWAGLLGLAVPLAVHLLARRRAPERPFPSLRFVPVTRPLATRRSRPTDLLLLALRLGIVVAAVAALAQPLLLTEERTARTAGALTRAVVVDTSASMQRSDAGGNRLADLARRQAEEAAEVAAVAAVLEVASLPDALRGAAAWLAPRGGLREIVVISDFQRGALGPRDAEAIPDGMGLELRRVGEAELDEVGAQGGVAASTVIPHGPSETHLHLILHPDRTEAEWRRWVTEEPAPDGLLLLGAEEAAARAIRLAAFGSEAAPAVPRDRPVAVLLPGHADPATILAGARPLDRPWMGDAAAALRTDPELAHAAWAAAVESEDAAGASGSLGALLPLALTARGEPAVLAGSATIEGTDHLLLVVRAPAASPTAAALLAAAARAASTAPPIEELEPELVSRSELAALARRAAPARGAPGEGDESDGRWLWLLALGLLGAEGVTRTRMQSAREGGEEPEGGEAGDG